MRGGGEDERRRRRRRRSSLIIAKNDLKRHARTLSGDTTGLPPQAGKAQRAPPTHDLPVAGDVLSRIAKVAWEEDEAELGSASSCSPPGKCQKRRVADEAEWLCGRAVCVV